MDEVTIIGMDIAKRVFHAHGAHADGRVAFRKRLARSQVLSFFAKQPRCTVAMEACATAHDWGRAISELGHEIRLIPPAYVKPFVKRQKNDTADAEAIAEAAVRPTMRFVAVKTEEQQARSMIFRTRDLLVRNRTQLINALRGHLAEHGVIAPCGPANVGRLAAAIDGEDSSLPPLVREIGAIYLEQIEILDAKIADLEKLLRHEAQLGAETSRLQTMPGIGPITAIAIETFAPPMQTFKRGATLRPGSVLCQSNIRAEASSGLDARQKWASVTSAGFDHWRHGCHPMGVKARRAGRILAQPYAGAETFDARRHGPRKQDGPHGVGDVGQAGEPQRFGRNDGVI